MRTSRPARAPARPLFVAAFVTALAPAVARADLPRPEGWEPSCTLAKMQKAGTTCEACRGYQNPDPCQDDLKKKGYTRQCEEGGAGSYVAIWCKAGAPPATPTESASAAAPAPAPATSGSTAPAPPVAPSSPPAAPSPATSGQGSSGCGVVATAGERPAEGAAFLTGVLGLALGRRRRR